MTKYKLEKLLDLKGSYDGLARELIEVGIPYSYDDEEDRKKLLNLIRQWKSRGRIPKKYKPYIDKLVEKYGIQVVDEKDEKLLEYAFINFLKEIKISFYENKGVYNIQLFRLLIYSLILDKNIYAENIEKEWGEWGNLNSEEK